MLELCKKIVQAYRAKNDDLMLAVIDGSSYTPNELIHELAREYVQARTGGQVHKERADL